MTYSTVTYIGKFSEVIRVIHMISATPISPPPRDSNSIFVNRRLPCYFFLSFLYTIAHWQRTSATPHQWHSIQSCPRSFGSHLCQTISLITLSEASPPFFAVLYPPLRVDCCFTKPASTIGIAGAGCLLKVSSSFTSIKRPFVSPSTSFHSSTISLRRACVLP